MPLGPRCKNQPSRSQNQRRRRRLRLRGVGLVVHAGARAERRRGTPGRGSGGAAFPTSCGTSLIRRGRQDGGCRDCVHGGWLVADVDSWRFPHCSRAFQCRPVKGGEPRSFTIGVPRRIHQWRRRLLNTDLLPKWPQYFGSVCCPQCALPFGSWCFHALMVFAVKTGVHAECCRHPLVRGPRVRARVLA